MNISLNQKQNNYLQSLPVKAVAIDDENTQDRDDAIYIEDHGAYFFIRTLIANIVGPFQDIIHDLDIRARKNVSSLYHTPETQHMMPLDVVNKTSLGSHKNQKVFYVEFIFYKKTGEMKMVNVKFDVAESIKQFHYGNVGGILKKDKNDISLGIQKMMHVAYDFSSHYLLLLKSRRQKRSYSSIYDSLNVYKYSERKIKKEKYKKANLIIESFMCSTNEILSFYMNSKGIPYPSRIFTGEVQPMAKELFREILQKKFHRQKLDLNVEFYVNALSPMAFYDIGVHGHKDLACDFYSHSTSPIRRSADFFGQRNLYSWLTTGQVLYGWDELDEILCHINQVELARRLNRRVNKIIFFHKRGLEESKKQA